jgi:hypothetical protein
MFRKIAEVSEGINSVALVGSARSSANSPRDLIDGVETKLSSSLEIVWLEVFVKPDVLGECLVLQVRDLVFCDPNMIEQSQWKRFDFEDPRVESILLTAGFHLDELVIELITI